MGPRKSSDIVRLSMELGTGTSPQALRSEVISAQSNSVLKLEGSIIVQDSADSGPLPENFRISNPRGVISLCSI